MGEGSERAVEEVGITLRDAAPFAKFIRWLLVEDYELINPEEARPDPERVTVYLAKHGPFAVPFPAPALTLEWLFEQGGYDDLRALTLFHNVAEFIPGLSPILRHFFGHSTRKLNSMKSLIEMMRAREFQIIGTAPEASSCFGEYSESVGPFMRAGLIVAALEADADIIVAAQKGVEVFAVPLRIPFGFALPVRGRPRGLLVPYWRPGLRARVRVKYARFEPSVSYDERRKMSQWERRRFNGEAIEAVRRLMIELYDSIPDDP